jgi:ribosomal protein S17E
MSKEEVNFANLDSRDRFEILAARHLRISLPSIESIRDRDDYRSTGVSDLWQFWQVIASAEVSEVDRRREELAAITQDRDYCKRVASHNKELGEKAQQRLTAAEQRNAELVELLQSINSKASKSHVSQSLWQLKTDMANIAQATDAALKPTESGASA